MEVVKPPQFEKKYAGQIKAFPLHLQGETSMLFESTSIQSHLYTSQNVDAQYKKQLLLSDIILVL